jgi:hypothetical protein
MGESKERRLMASYAILWDIDRESSYPVGIAVEREDGVRVYLPSYYEGFRTHYTDPEYVLQPDISEREYRPGQPGYFDQIVAQLSRTFAIGKRGDLNRTDIDSIMDRLVEEVKRMPTPEKQFEAAKPPQFIRYAKMGAVPASPGQRRSGRVPRAA